MMDRLLTPDDVAEIMQVSRRTAYAIMHQMPHMMRPFRVSEAGLRAYITSRTEAPREERAPGRASRAPRRTAYPPLMPPDYHIPRRREIEKAAK